MPMVPAISAFDFVVLLFGLCVLIGIGVYFWRDADSGEKFLSSHRSLGALPLGISASRTLLASLPAYGLLNEAYFAGTKVLVLPLLLWCCWPFLSRVVLPLYVRLNVTSIYEYLELRFDRRVRRTAAVISILWRFAWLVALLSGTGIVLSRLFAESSHILLLVIVLGSVYTLYALLGGLRAVLWAGTAQALLALGALALVIVCIWQQLEGGHHRIADVAQATGRVNLVDPVWNPTEPWSLWTLVPHFMLIVLTLHVADQATLQHYLAARNLTEARRAGMWSWIYVTLFIAFGSYAGIAMLAYYHDHPQSLRAVWVANLDSQTGQTRTDAQGEPLVPWSPFAISIENLDRLLAERRLLRPNTNQPFDAIDVLVCDVAGTEQIDIQKLAKRKPPAGRLKQGEVLLHERARSELFPQWIASQNAVVLRGVWLAAIVVVSLLSFDATMMAICQIARSDLDRTRDVPAGIGPRADRETARGNGRPARMIVALGVLTVISSLAVLQFGEAGSAWVLRLAAGLGGPLLAVCLLGMFSRRTTAAAARAALLTGACAGAVLPGLSLISSSSRFWRVDLPLQANWLPVGSFLLALTLGALGGLVAGRRKPREQLRGLVAGIGQWGICQPATTVAIPNSFGENKEPTHS